jgi:hypothetical protein
MLSTDVEAFGVVREPGQAPYPAFAVAVAQPGAAPWVVYRRPAAFRVRLLVCICLGRIVCVIIKRWGVCNEVCGYVCACPGQSMPLPYFNRRFPQSHADLSLLLTHLPNPMPPQKTTIKQALSDRLRELLPGMPPCPATAFAHDGSGVGGATSPVPGGAAEMSLENLHHARTQLQVCCVGM